MSVWLLILEKALLLSLSTMKEVHGVFLILDICILYIFTSLFPSHNHPIREAGHCWQMRESRPEGLATLLKA